MQRGPRSPEKLGKIRLPQRFRSPLVQIYHSPQYYQLIIFKTQTAELDEVRQTVTIILSHPKTIYLK